MLTLQVNTLPVKSWLNDIQRQHLPFATAIALTGTAKYVRAQVINEMKRQFDRPKPSTVNETKGPLYLKSADYKKLRAGQHDYAEVGVKDTPMPKGDPALAWLSHHIRGGRRIEKRSEFLLRTAGVLPPGYFAVPGSGARLNKYGNMSTGQIQQILSAVRAQRDSHANTPYAPRGRNARRNLTQGDYFVASRNRSRTAHLPEGVWERYGRSRFEIRPVLIFVPAAPRYRKRLKFFEMCEQVGRSRYRIEFHLAMRRALATAKVERQPLARAA